MTDRDAFISRWARRKREAAKGEDRPRARANLSAAEAADAPRIEGKVENAMRDGVDSSGASGEPAFDLSKLPSIESITADTDIRPFLARGVPSALRQAALRKMWVADPAIRDFIEVAENQWDFNAPGEILGFDLSPPVGDVRRMVARILGDQSNGEPEPEGAAAAGKPESPPIEHASAGCDDCVSQEVSTSDHSPAAPPIDQTHVNVASQNNGAPQHRANAAHKRRSHGGAMPA
jgi:hypothetical protein